MRLVLPPVFSNRLLLSLAQSDLVVAPVPGPCPDQPAQAPPRGALPVSVGGGPGGGRAGGRPPGRGHQPPGRHG